jgi:pimeloyl-ACP methyl ester carboxylesterase
MVRGATGYRDFYPLELDTRELQVVTGYVTDEFNGRAIQYAHVQLNGVGGHVLNTDTDVTGFYRFTELDPDEYPFTESTLEVMHAGYLDAAPYALSMGCCPVSTELRSKTVVLMHGFGGSYQGTWGGNTGVFGTTLTGQGFNVVGVDVGGFPRNILPVSIAEGALRTSLEYQCRQQGIQSYDVVAHSMGGLATRSYLSKSYGRDRVNKLVMLGTPNHGTFLASEALASSRLFKLALGLLSGGLYGTGDVSYMAERTALLDLTPGSSFLNMLNYGSSLNTHELEPCQSLFNENSINGRTTIYSIAGTHPTGWFNVGRILLGCWWVPSDGVVLKPRAYYHDGITCTDSGLDCEVHHKVRSVGFAQSACIAVKVAQLLLDGSFDCDERRENEAGEARSRLPTIEGVVQLGGSFQDSTLINAASVVDFLCVCAADSLDYTLESPSGQLIDPEYCADHPSMEYIRGIQSAFYSIQNPEAGHWRHYVATFGSAEPDTLTLIASFDGAVTLAANVDSGIDPEGEFTLEATFTEAGSVIPAGVVIATATRPGGEVEQVELLDDGLSPDEVYGDGIYTVDYPAEGEIGNYTFVFTAVTDPQSSEAEYREARQVSTATLLPDPALVGSGLVIADSDVPLGSLVDLSASFTNQGTATADSATITLGNANYGVVLADTLAAR